MMPDTSSNVRRQSRRDDNSHGLERAEDESTASFGEEEVSLFSASNKKEAGVQQPNPFTGRIFLSKLLVLVVLVVSATAASISTYRFTSRQETKQFEQQVSLLLVPG